MLFQRTRKKTRHETSVVQVQSYLAASGQVRFEQFQAFLHSTPPLSSCPSSYWMPPWVQDLAKSFDLVHGESLSLIMNLRTLEQLHKAQWSKKVEIKVSFSSFGKFFRLINIFFDKCLQFIFFSNELSNYIIESWKKEIFYIAGLKVSKFQKFLVSPKMWAKNCKHFCPGTATKKLKVCNSG